MEKLCLKKLSALKYVQQVRIKENILIMTVFSLKIPFLWIDLDVYGRIFSTHYDFLKYSFVEKNFCFS